MFLWPLNNVTKTLLIKGFYHKEGRLRGPVSVWRSQKSGIGAASWGAI